MASGQRRWTLTPPAILDGLVVLPCYLIAVHNPFVGATIGSAPASVSWANVALPVREILCMLLVLVAWHVSFRSLRLYSEQRVRSTYEEVGAIVWATLFGTVAIAFISAIVPANPPTLHALLIFFVLATAVMVVCRTSLRALQRALPRGAQPRPDRIR